MYKNGIPAEYLARRALHSGWKNNSQHSQLRDEYGGTWNRKPIRRREMTSSAMGRYGSLKEPQSNAT